MDDFDPLSLQTSPTAARPLLGLTILVVEDSRYSCDALRLLCLRSGARIRRADCIASAHRHLQVYRPSVILVDVGLPDGSGIDLIAELAEVTPRINIILGLSGDDTMEKPALAAGADGFFAKPIENISTFQETILAHLPPERRPLGPRPLQDSIVRPDPVSYNDDLTHVASLINDASQNGRTLSYIAQFVTGVAKSARDEALENAGRELAAAQAGRHPVGQSVTKLTGLLRQRLDGSVAI